MYTVSVFLPNAKSKNFLEFHEIGKIAKEES